MCRMKRRAATAVMSKAREPTMEGTRMARWLVLPLPASASCCGALKGGSGGPVTGVEVSGRGEVAGGVGAGLPVVPFPTGVAGGVGAGLGVVLFAPGPGGAVEGGGAGGGGLLGRRSATCCSCFCRVMRAARSWAVREEPDPDPDTPVLRRVVSIGGGGAGGECRSGQVSMGKQWRGGGGGGV